MHHKDKNKKKVLTEEKWQQKAEEYLNGWKRAQADYHNLQKEIEKKKIEWIKMANADLLISLLPVYDNLKLALKHMPKEEKHADWIIGIEHIKNQFRKVLADNGVEEIKTVGLEFNPELHEVVASEEIKKEGNSRNKVHSRNEGKGKDIIKKEVRAGYMLNGKLLYPAKVII